jgi:hypothetical protein
MATRDGDTDAFGSGDDGGIAVIATEGGAAVRAASLALGGTVVGLQATTSDAEVAIDATTRDIVRSMDWPPFGWIRRTGRRR